MEEEGVEEEVEVQGEEQEVQPEEQEVQHQEHDEGGNMGSDHVVSGLGVGQFVL